MTTLSIFGDVQILFRTFAATQKNPRKLFTSCISASAEQCPRRRFLSPKRIYKITAFFTNENKTINIRK
jgi:hypothetical protein